MKKRVLSFVLALVMLVGLMPLTAYANELRYPKDSTPHRYSSDYREWSQGASAYNGVREVGCFIVAQARMLYEAGIDRSPNFNPDTYMEWEVKYNFLLGGLNGQNQWDFNQTDSSGGPEEYARQRGRKLTYIEDIPVKQPITETLWDNVRNGYYTIIHVQNGSNHHYVLIANEESIKQNALCFYESYRNGDTAPILRLDTARYPSGGGRIYSSIITEFFTYKGEICDHIYNNSGVCKECKQPANYMATADYSCAGTYTANQKIFFRKTPYETGGLIDTYETGKAVQVNYSISNFVNADVSKGEIGILWYNVTIDNVNGWVVYNKLTKTANPKVTISCSGPKAPTSVAEGAGFFIEGIVSVTGSQLKRIKAYCPGTNLSTGWVTVSGTTYNLYKSDVDKAFLLYNLKPGTYQYVVEVETASGVTKSFTSNYFTVTARTTVTAPTITQKSEDFDSKTFRIAQTTSGATLYYWYQGCGTDSLSTNNSYVDVTVTDTSEIAAYSQKNGVIARTTKYVNIPQLAPPTITVEYVAGEAYFTVSAEQGAYVFTSVDNARWSPGYGGRFRLDGADTIYAKAMREGYKTSSKASLTAILSVPDAPNISLLSAKDIAAGNSISFAWNASGNASSYNVFVYRDGTLVRQDTTTKTSYAFLTDYNDSTDQRYTVHVTASNSAGDSAQSNTLTCTAHRPLKVSFINDDDTVLSEQTVSYGGTASALNIPSKRGYVFKGWGSKGLENITADTVFKAQYEKKVYTVEFLDANGRSLSKQYVAYMNSADEPDTGSIAFDEGCVFSGWAYTYVKEHDSAMDFTHVDSDMTIQAVGVWWNQELPLLISDVAAERKSGSTSDVYYEISYSVKNGAGEAKNAMIRFVLTNDDGQMLKTGYREIRLNANEKTSFCDTLVYEGTATRLSVYALGIVDSEKTGSAYSPEATARVVEKSTHSWNAWSEWTATPLTATEDMQVETKTQYQYRDKMPSESTSSSMAGWTCTNLNNPEIRWNAWSGWTYGSTSLPSSGPLYKVDSTSYTQHRYYRCYCPRCGNDWYGGRQCNCGGYIGTYDYQWSRTDPWTLDANGAFDWGFLSSRAVARTWGLDGRSGFWYYYPNTSNADWQYITRTAYDYRTATGYYVYHFEKWGDYSAWRDEPVAATSTRQVQTRTLYRSRDKAYEEVTGETTNANSYPCNGRIDISEDLSGKLATIMVYNVKNTDPNESQLQYVGQTTIGSGNSYSFSFIPKEEPTDKTGDFVISLGIQGSTGLVNVGIINSPKEKHKVEFLDKDGASIRIYNSLGEEITEAIPGENGLTKYVQYVETGSNAIVPDAAEYTGYSFIGWNNDPTNIQKDSVIAPYYVEDTFYVVFVDWLNESITVSESYYGDTLTLPQMSVAETSSSPSGDATGVPLVGASAPTESEAKTGYTFNGWFCNGQKAEDGMTITGSMVFEADYTAEKYLVRFFNEDGSLMEGGQQEVEVGKAAELPAENPNVSEGKVFLGWSTDAEWWNVTQDMDVLPITAYEHTTAMPVANIPNESFGTYERLELSSEHGATIYYTNDGSVPEPEKVGEENCTTRVYDGEIELTDTSFINAVATMDGKNTSEVVSIVFFYDNSLSVETEKPELQSIDERVVHTQGGEEVTVELSIEDNPGINGYVFYVNADPRIFSVKDDAAIGSGEDIDSTGMLVIGNYEENLGWPILWYSSETVSVDGSLFEIILTVRESIPEGDYPISVTLCKSDLILGEDVENWDDDSISMSIGSDSIILGDVNGDGMLTVIDVVLIARSVIRLIDLSPNQLTAADVNGDGKVNNVDVIKLVRFVAGLETTFGIDTSSLDFSAAEEVV